MSSVYLVLNAGSSSIKFQLFDAGGVDEPQRIYRGLFDGLGSSPHFSVRNQAGEIAGEMRWGEAEPFGHDKALAHLAGWIRVNSKSEVEVIDSLLKVLSSVAQHYNDLFNSRLVEVLDAVTNNGCLTEGQQRLKGAHAF